MITCALKNCFNQFPRNGKQKYCCRNHSKQDQYHRSKNKIEITEVITTSYKGTHQKPNMIKRFNLCKDCNGTTKLIHTQVNSNNNGKYYVRIGRVCLFCNVVTIDPKFNISNERVKVIPRLMEIVA